ncbi:hypothetical protein MMC13_003301 [Lambiella insularis]|nr:hypothetical protein [Lambiella insularis]
MRLSSRSSLAPLSILFSLLLIATFAAAQAVISGLPNLSTITSNTASTSDGSSTASSGSTQTSGTDASSVTITNSNTDLPSLTTSSDYDGITDGPKLPGAFSYPAPSVPPTAMAPFMQQSSLPSGTVFIIVGAIIGFFAFLVLAWRGVVAWSLHRSVRRAHNGDRYGRIRGEPSKGLFRGAGVPFYSDGNGSSLSLNPLVGDGKGGKKGHTPQSSLFFSPTAGAGMHTPASRTSTYLPAGYYAAGNAAPANGAGTTHVGGGSRLSQLADLGPQRQGYTRAQSYGPSPPRSPSLQPTTRERDKARLSNAGLSAQPTAGATGLSAPARDRAPSEYLDELFDYPPDGRS